MDSGTQNANLPSLTADFLGQPNTLVDNLFADLWRKLGIPSLLTRFGFKKRTGLDVTAVVYLLLLWVWVTRESIGMFARNSLQSFAQAHKDVLYDFLAREDQDWRALHGGVVSKVYRVGQLKKSRIRAYVLDDSVKIRRGKKLEGVSLHFDHLTGRTVKGQQVLTLGLATEEAFLPLDSDIFISSKGGHDLKEEFADGRSIEARRYRSACQCSKPELARAMMQRAQRNGIEADYLLGDAWFGTKPMIVTALELGTTPILRMKKNKMHYRLTTWNEGEKHIALLDAKALYQHGVRKHWQRVQGFPYQTATLDVELNLAAERQPDKWVTVRLVFVRGLAETDAAPQASANSWALFLTTDTRLQPAELLEIYALRWGIEVYFKEAKQYLGLLWEQTETFASHIASIHATAIRYCMLVYAKLQGTTERVCEARDTLREQLTRLDFAKRLWGCFRALIHEALAGLQDALGIAVESLMAVIEEHVQGFFVQALQLDEFTLQLEASDGATEAS